MKRGRGDLGLSHAAFQMDCWRNYGKIAAKIVLCLAFTPSEYILRSLTNCPTKVSIRESP